MEYVDIPASIIAEKILSFLEEEIKEHREEIKEYREDIKNSNEEEIKRCEYAIYALLATQYFIYELDIRKVKWGLQ